MRVLTTIGCAGESGEREYVATAFSKVMTAPYLEAFAIHTSEHAGHATNRVPEYVELRGYKSPVDSGYSPLQFVLKTDLPSLSGFAKAQRELDASMCAMPGIKLSRRHRFEWYPVAEQLLSPLENDKSEQLEYDFLVDMGGGKGHHLEALTKVFPSTKGHLVLQDLPGIIASLENLDPGIRLMVHDIFSPSQRSAR